MRFLRIFSDFECVLGNQRNKLHLCCAIFQNKLNLLDNNEVLAIVFAVECPSMDISPSPLAAVHDGAVIPMNTDCYAKSLQYREVVKGPG